MLWNFEKKKEKFYFFLLDERVQVGKGKKENYFKFYELKRVEMFCFPSSLFFRKKKKIKIHEQ